MIAFLTYTLSPHNDRYIHRDIDNRNYDLPELLGPVKMLNELSSLSYDSKMFMN